MYCNKCGAQVGASDIFCPYCGARLPHQPQGMPGLASGRQDDAPDRGEQWSRQQRSHGLSAPKRKSGNGGWWIALAVAAAIAMIGGALYMGISHEDEETLWAQCENSQDFSDLASYLKQYPHGEHAQQAKALYDYLLAEKELWEHVSSGENEYQLRSFIADHPKSRFLEQARDRLDDLVWNKAVAANTKAAYRAYVNEFPAGKYAPQARSYFDELTRAELTIAERDNVIAAVRQFLGALEDWNVNDMLYVCNPSMQDFMGKSNATHADVEQYYNTFRESDIDSIAFSALSVNVNKIMENGTPSYTAQFTMARHLTRQFPERGTEAMMRGEATLDPAFRFTTLSIDRQ